MLPPARTRHHHPHLKRSYLQYKRSTRDPATLCPRHFYQRQPGMCATLCTTRNQRSQTCRASTLSRSWSQPLRIHRHCRCYKMRPQLERRGPCCTVCTERCPPWLRALLDTPCSLHCLPLRSCQERTAGNPRYQQRRSYLHRKACTSRRQLQQLSQEDTTWLLHCHRMSAPLDRHDTHGCATASGWIFLEQ